MVQFLGKESENMIKNIFCIVLMLCLLSGCKKSDPLVGKWTAHSENGAVEMELTKDHKINFGENNGTWQRTEDGKVLLAMKSGQYTAEVKGPILNFVVADKDVVFTKNK